MESSFYNNGEHLWGRFDYYLSYAGIWRFSSSIRRLMTSSHLPWIFSTAKSSFGVHWNKIKTKKMSRPRIISMWFAWLSCEWSVPGGWRCRVWAFCWPVCSCTTNMRISLTPGRVTNGGHDGEDASSKQAKHFKYVNAQLTNECTS